MQRNAWQTGDYHVLAWQTALWVADMDQPLPPLSIAEAADEIVYYERSEPFQPTGEVRLGRGFDDPGRAALFSPPPSTLAIRNFRIADAYLDTACMLLIKRGRKIPETAYLLSEYDYDHAQVLHQQVVELEPRIEYVIGCTRDQGYYHWVVQAVPAIDWAIRSRPHDTVTLALPPLNPFHLASLELLGHQGVPRLQLLPHHHYHFPRVSHSEFLTGTMPFGISRAAQSTFHRLRDAVEERKQKASIIYVARSDSARRITINEPELIRELTAEGVHVVVPGTLSLADQIALFKQADAVIAPHGAGLTNAVFCKPGALVYELVPEHYLNFCFSRLVQASGLHYWADIFPPFGDGDGHDRKWAVDIGIVVRRLSAIRERIDSVCRVSMATPGAMDYLRQNPAMPPQPMSRAGSGSNWWSRILQRWTKRRAGD